MPKKMIPERKVVHLSLSGIDLTDTRYRISRPGEDISGLALSIKENGLASLPIIKKQGNIHIPVSGFKRFEALGLNGYKGLVPCQVLPEARSEDLAVLAVSENALHREIGPGELIRAVCLLANFMDKEEIAGRSQGIFNTRLNTRYIGDLIRIGRMGGEITNLLDSGRLSIKAAKKISELGRDAARCLVDLFSIIKVSSGKQMEIVVNFLEITRREKIEPADLYKEKKIQAFLGKGQGSEESYSHGSTPEHKDFGSIGNKVREYLVSRRYPVLDQAKKKTREKVRALKLPPKIRMTLPENFEGMTYSMAFDFKSIDEFENQVSSLTSLSLRPELKEILNR